MGFLDRLTKMWRANPPRERVSRAARYSTQGFSCLLGDVEDLSATGMKVRCPGEPGVTRDELLQMRIASPFQQVPVRARVAWKKQDADGTWAVGLQFSELPAYLAQTLDQMAREGIATTAGQPGPRRGQSVRGTLNGHEVPPRTSIIEATVRFEDLYVVLGVPVNADEQAIRDAYRRHVRECHPDVSTDPQATFRFQQLRRAYEVLRDPEQRARYDDLRRERDAA